MSYSAHSSLHMLPMTCANFLLLTVDTCSSLEFSWVIFLLCFSHIPGRFFLPKVTVKHVLMEMQFNEKDHVSLEREGASVVSYRAFWNRVREGWNLHVDIDWTPLKFTIRFDKKSAYGSKFWIQVSGEETIYCCAKSL